MLTLIIYDISEDNYRSKLVKFLQEYGLKRIQYSGFLGDINPNDRIVMAKEIEKFISSEKDSIYMVPMCNRCKKLTKIISKENKELEDLEKVKIL
ncbi:MAG: CRISPR-associated endonuclease Cas2 [Candidatus Aenigmatarchaeota archaeon]|nr:CRISPR-associated endonuclease Cas2 [Methanothermobacter sp.]